MQRAPERAHGPRERPALPSLPSESRAQHSQDCRRWQSGSGLDRGCAPSTFPEPHSPLPRQRGRTALPACTGLRRWLTRASHQVALPRSRESALRPTTRVEPLGDHAPLRPSSSGDGRSLTAGRPPQPAIPKAVLSSSLCASRCTARHRNQRRSQSAPNAMRRRVRSVRTNRTMRSARCRSPTIH